MVIVDSSDHSTPQRLQASVLTMTSAVAVDTSLRHACQSGSPFLERTAESCRRHYHSHAGYGSTAATPLVYPSGHAHMLPASAIDRVLATLSLPKLPRMLGGVIVRSFLE
ncbi:MAG: hypothetical protein JWO36_4637 [Myxococcales bacterium]|nr:hypothetical protein [Myxococcales bacterium]